MFRFKPATAVCVLTCALLPMVGNAAAPAKAGAKKNEEVAELRAALDALKSEYTNRVNALEARVKQLEAEKSATNSAAAASADATTNGALGSPDAAAAPGSNAPGATASGADAAVSPDVLAAAAEFAASEAAPSSSSGPSPYPSTPPSGVAGSGASAFNPAISLILAGNYASLSEDPGTYHIQGFIPNDGEIGPGERSFNLGESELTLSANIDPYFSGTLTTAISGDNEIAVEEAFVRTLALNNGLTAKGGRFFSGIGYLNEVHAHAWDFIDQPLVYQAFVGGQLAQDGVQVRWLAPTDLFMELGAETGSGRGFPGNNRNSNGLSGNALFVHFGGDIGDSTSWRSGVSWLDHRADNRSYEDVDAGGLPVVNAFTGRARTWVVDATLKWAPPGDVTRRQLKVQGEYMRRSERGDLAFDTEGAAISDLYRSSQSGWYVQSVYQFIPRWRVGARYDQLHSGSPHIFLVDSGTLSPQDFPALLAASPSRVTTMLDWNPSEFTRLRAQIAWDDARDAERDREFFLQYIYSIGAHGAHKY